MKILYLPNEYSQQRQFQKKANIYPVRLAMECEWRRRNGDEVKWDSKVARCMWADKIITEPENLPFLSLPAPDRLFTNAYTYTSGNYKYLSGTHIMSASGCWWGACEFCVEKGKPYEVRPVGDVIQELYECEKQGFREVFDDSATFPVGEWLDEFCYMKRYTTCKGLAKLPLGCNMRMVDVDYKMMKDAGFRMILFGLESANQETLGRIHKGTYTTDIKYIIKASEAGLEPHIAVMFGYPWETDEDALRTLKLVHWLLRKGYAKTAQASFYTPPDGKNNTSQNRYVHKIYNAGWYPDFWFHQLKDIRNLDDIKYIWRGIKCALKF